MKWPLTRRTTIAAVAVLCVMLGGGYAGYTMVLSPGDGSGSDVNYPDATMDAKGPPEFTVNNTNIERCGFRCRTTDLYLTNNQPTSVENVTVRVHVKANGTHIKTVNHTIGTLEPNETKMSSADVQASYGETAIIKRNDGYVELKTVVETGSNSFVYWEQVELTQ